MKLFNVIAAAAVIGTSFIAPNPAEARNGWVYMGEQDGASNYIKPVGRNGRIASVLSKWSDQPEQPVLTTTAHLGKRELEALGKIGLLSIQVQ